MKMSALGDGVAALEARGAAVMMSWQGGPPVEPSMQPPQGAGGGEQPYYGPPGQKPESSGWRFVAIGCVALIVITVLVLGGGGVLCYYKGSEFMAGAMRQGKPELMGQLTPDHTEAQEQRFGSAYDAFVDEMEKTGFVEWAQKNKDIYADFQQMISDQEITVEESQGWAAKVEDRIGRPEESEEY